VTPVETPVLDQPTRSLPQARRIVGSGDVNGFVPDRAEKRLRMRMVLAGESTGGGIFDRLINAKFWRHSMLIFWTNIIRENGEDGTFNVISVKQMFLIS